jgi:hypothetical protein
LQAGARLRRLGTRLMTVGYDFGDEHINRGQLMPPSRTKPSARLSSSRMVGKHFD